MSGATDDRDLGPVLLDAAQAAQGIGLESGFCPHPGGRAVQGAADAAGAQDLAGCPAGEPLGQGAGEGFVLGVGVRERGALHSLGCLGDRHVLPAVDVGQAGDVIAGGGVVAEEEGAGRVGVVVEGGDVVCLGGAVGVPADEAALLEQADVAVTVGGEGARIGAEVGFLCRGGDPHNRRGRAETAVEGGRVDGGCGVELLRGQITLGDAVALPAGRTQRCVGGADLLLGAADHRGHGHDHHHRDPHTGQEQHPHGEGDPLRHRGRRCPLRRSARVCLLPGAEDAGVVRGGGSCCGRRVVCSGAAGFRGGVGRDGGDGGWGAPPAAVGGGGSSGRGGVGRRLAGLEGGGGRTGTRRMGRRGCWGDSAGINRLIPYEGSMITPSRTVSSPAV